MRILKIGFGGVVLLAIAAALFVYRPWTPYKPLPQLASVGVENAAWNHRSMDTLFQHHVVKAGAPAPLPRTLHDLPALAVEGYDGTLADHLERNKTTALIIIQNGTVLYENYWQGGNGASRYTSWSAAKSFTSTIVGMAIKRGFIGGLDDRADQYVAAFKGTAFEGVTLRNLMNMSSGMKIDKLNLPGGENAGDSNTLIGNWIFFGTAMSGQISDYGRAAQPGTTWNYNNLDTHALLMVVEAATGRRWADLVSEWLWQPLGAVADATWLVNEDSADAEALGFCCFQARADDYARLGLLMLADGEWNGERLLPEGWVESIAQPRQPRLQEKGYHLQWWLDTARPGVFAAKGRWGQTVNVYPAQNVVIVRMSVDSEEMSHGRERWDFNAAMADWAEKVAAQP